MREATDWHPDEQALAAFDAGALSDAPWATIEDHVARCAACCGRLEQLPADPLSAMVHDFGARTLASTGTDAPSTLNVPAELLQHARYRIVALLGAGGMGVVFKAEHRLMNRTVAVKVMHRRLMDRPAAVTQFGEEVRAAARLSHPHIVAAYDAEQAGDVHFLVMEFITGTSLDRLVAERGPLPVGEACTYVRQAALGLQHAFEHGMVHRDIKPHNLMLSVAGSAPPGHGMVKILDFGLARLAYAAPPGKGRDDPAGTTRPPTITGTPDYIAPEQAAAPQRADTRADIYGLGCTLFYLLTGRPPFHANTPEATIAGHMHQPAPAIGALRRDVPAGLAAVLERMLAKDPARRYQTPADVARVLEPYGGNGTRSRPLRRWVGLGAAAIAVAAILAGVWLRPGSQADPITELPEKAAAEPAPPIVAPPIVAPPIVVPPVNKKPAPAGEVPPASRPDVRGQVVAWLRENNVFGPDHAFVAQQADAVAKPLANGHRVELSIGSGLLTTGKAALLTTRGGQLFIRDYSAAQVTALGLDVKQTHYKEAPDHRNPRREPADIELSDLHINQADAMNPQQPVTGTVAYRLVGRMARKFALRFYRVPNTRGLSSFQYFKAGIPPGGGSLSFTFGPLAAVGGARRTTIPVFLDMLAFDESQAPADATVVSNTLITLVTVAPPE